MCAGLFCAAQLILSPFGRSCRYEDILEIPLQPLYDNLTSYTYEVFEKDPIKYIFYQRAIESALRDKISDEEAETKTVGDNCTLN